MSNGTYYDGTRVVNRRVPRYQISVTIWKALFSWLRHLGVLSAADLAMFTPPETFAELKTHWPVLLIAAIPALWRTLENIRKNWNDNGKPLWKWPWDKIISVSVLSLLLLGCATTSVEFVDTDGANTRLRNTVVFGKQDASVINAGYEWNEDGSGEWNVGGESIGTDVEKALSEIREALSSLVLLLIKMGLSPI